MRVQAEKGKKELLTFFYGTSPRVKVSGIWCDILGRLWWKILHVGKGKTRQKNWWYCKLMVGITLLNNSTLIQHENFHRRKPRGWWRKFLSGVKLYQNIVSHYAKCDAIHQEVVWFFSLGFLFFWNVNLPGSAVCVKFGKIHRISKTNTIIEN